MQRAILENRVRNLAVIAASVLALAACGGGGGGGDHGGGGGLGSGTFTRIFNGTPTGAFQVPFGIGTWGDSTTQALYTPAEVRGSGRITMLRFTNAVANAAPRTCPNTTIRIGHSSLGALTTTFGTNINLGAPQIVLSDATVTVPTTAGATFDIPLATPFNYNGFDNLVVQVDRTTVCSGAGVFGVTTGVTAASRLVYSGATDSTPGTAQNDTTTAAFTDDDVPWIEFVFAGGDNLVLAADRAGDNGNFIAPASTGRTQALILATDITGSGPITGIQFRPSAALAAPLTGTYKITLSHVPAATTQLASTTFASNVGSGATVVAQNVPVTLPLGTTEWWVPLSGSFSYDGTSNLLIDVEATVTAGGAVTAYQNVGGTRILAAVATTDVTGNLILRGLEPKLRFHGGQVVLMPPATNPGVPAAQVLGGIAGQVQSLYRNDLIGTSGTISAVYVRLAGASTADTLTNYKLYMGHTTKTTYVITDTYASNMTENATVFSGTLTIPAGLAAGDWIKITLSSPFAYNSAQNLSILFTTDAGAGGNAALARRDANRLPGHIVGRNDNAVSTTGTPTFTENAVMDLVVDLAK